MNNKRVHFSLPIRLFLIILIAFLLGPLFPQIIKSVFLTISVNIKVVLLFCLPLIVFLLVFSSFANLSGGLIIFTGLLLALICLSNFSGLMFSYFVANIFENMLTTSSISQTKDLVLQTIYEFNLFKICDNSTALIAGLFFGIYTSVTDNHRLKSFAEKGAKIVNLGLSKLFTPILPLFILGFLLKAQHEGLLNILLKNCIPLLSVILLAFVSYIGFLYLVSCKFNFNRMLVAIKNIVPAAIVGFSSMSSVAAMPVLINGSTKNSKDQTTPKAIIPFITNTHMMGDAIAIPLMAISLYIIEYNTMPSFEQFLFFAFAYVLAKFASAGVPGGTILIMTPVLEAKLGFTSEMSAIILTTYLFFDPFCTMGSVFGNGVFTIFFEKAKSILIPTSKSEMLKS